VWFPPGSAGAGGDGSDAYEHWRDRNVGGEWAVVLGIRIWRHREVWRSALKSLDISTREMEKDARSIAV
jgi:hypothetical protein